MAEILPTWQSYNVQSLKRFSKIRLIVADIDGTLLPSDLSQTIQDLVGSLNHYRYQVNLTLATGRTLAGVKPLLEKLKLNPKIPLVLYNGSLIIRGDNFSTIYKRTISLTSLGRILSVASNFEVRVYTYFYIDPLFQPDFSSENEFVLGWAFNCTKEEEFNKMDVEWSYSLDNLNIEPSAILIETPSNPEESTRLEKLLIIDNQITVTRSGSKYLEIRPGQSNKGIALEHLAAIQQLKQDEILALGDNDNDAEMLEWAGIGVAIANASNRALSECDFVSNFGVFEGAVEILRLVKHAKHYYFIPQKKL